LAVKVHGMVRAVRMWVCGGRYGLCGAIATAKAHPKGALASFEGVTSHYAVIFVLGAEFRGRRAGLES
jgi:hypothetical protein